MDRDRERCAKLVTCGSCGCSGRCDVAAESHPGAECVRFCHCCVRIATPPQALPDIPCDNYLDAEFRKVPR